jgi:hypothetical protein
VTAQAEGGSRLEAKGPAACGVSDGPGQGSGYGESWRVCGGDMDTPAALVQARRSWGCGGQSLSG